MGNASRKIIAIVIAYVLLAPVLLFSAPTNAGRNPLQEKSQNGLQTTTINTPQGRVVVRLPDDIRAGDTISGTVTHEATGDKTKSSSFVLEVEGNRPTPISEKIFTFVVPAAGTSLPMILKGGTGSEVGRAAIPIQPPMSAPPSNLVLPRIGQAGRDLPIQGPFDGEARNTSVTIGGKLVDIIAESPRKVVMRVPPTPNGPTTISVNEQGKTTTAEFRDIGVNLSAPKTRLTRGEKTTVTVKVIGLQGIKHDVPMDLVTTGVVNMQGGNTQQITIKPNEVEADGSASLTRTITGVQAGNFNVTATVVVPISNLDGAVIHVEGTPNGGNGVWQVKVKMPDGTIVNIYIRSEPKPDLKFCNWIQISDVTSENGTIYVGKYKKVPPPKPPETPKPPDTSKPPDTPKPPGPSTKPPGETTEPPPCTEGATHVLGSETKTFEVMDPGAEVTFRLYTDKDGAGDAAANMAGFWKKIAKAGGLLDYLPEGTGAGSTAAGWLFEYLDKGADILDALAKGKLKNLGVSKVTAEVIITTKKITATCITYEICIKGKWVTKKKLEQAEERSVFRASKTASKGDSEWEKVSQPSTPQFFDPDLAEKWARDFFKDQANILKGNGEAYADFVKNCK